MQKLKGYDKKVAFDVDIDSNKTLTGGKSVSIIDQMLGNFGKYGTTYDK